MNTYENNTQQAPNAQDFLGGNYLRKEDLKGAETVTVTNVWSEAVLNSGRKKLIVAFRELEKPLILNKTNIKNLARIFGTGDTSAWRGAVTLYVETGVEYAGRVVGGIRVRPASAKPAGGSYSPAQPADGNGSRESAEHQRLEAEFDGF